LTTPNEIALSYSSFVLPLPPWKTRNLQISFYKEKDQQRFGILSVKFLFSIFLMFAEEFGVETDVAGFVDTMDISEACGDGEVRANFCEIAVYIPNIFWLGV
jgi:hypothetical protein